MLFRERSALAGMIGTSPQSIRWNSSNRSMSKSPRYGRYWSETKRIIFGARLDPDRYTVAWSKGTPRNTAFAPSSWIAWVSQGTQGALRNVPGPLWSNPPLPDAEAPCVNMSGCVVTLPPPLSPTRPVGLACMPPLTVGSQPSTRAGNLRGADEGSGRHSSRGWPPSPPSQGAAGPSPGRQCDRGRTRGNRSRASPARGPRPGSAEPDPPGSARSERPSTRRSRSDRTLPGGRLVRIPPSETNALPRDGQGRG